MSAAPLHAPPEVVTAAPTVRRVPSADRAQPRSGLVPPRPGAEFVPATGGRPLDAPSRTFFESRFAHDFSRVRIHADDVAASAARRVQARAFTVGEDVVFGAQQFAPGTEAGDRLIAHQLTHVAQQAQGGGGAGVLQRAPVDGAGAAKPPAAEAEALPALPYARLARQIFEAIEGPGTDEEAIYRALGMLERHPAAVAELKRVYKREHDIVLLDDLEDDLDGNELEFALELMGVGRGTGPRRVDRDAPTEPLGLTEAASRLREAFAGDTDEEAAYAVLVPFRKRTLPLQREYQAQYGEDLRDRLVEEMSGSQLDYALSLFETPYEFYVQEGNARLAGAPFGPFGDTTFSCLAGSKDMSDGSREYTYWYDREYWEPNVVLQEGLTTCQVQLLPGKDPAEAIDAMFDHQDRWKIACAEFVQIVHLYALRKTLGAKLFASRVTGEGLRLELQRRQSTGLVTEVTFSRTSTDGAMSRSDTGKLDARAVDDILAAAPIGSRVRWTNSKGESKGKEFNNWQNENTIKLGPDKFAAQGTASGVLTKTNSHTRAEIEDKVARKTFADADAVYIRKNIYISEIEIFDDPLAE